MHPLVSIANGQRRLDCDDRREAEWWILFFNSNPYLLDDAFQILFDISIGKAHNKNFVFFEKIRSFLIVSYRVVLKMLTTVYLNTKFLLRTIKIQDVGTDAILTIKVDLCLF